MGRLTLLLDQNSSESGRLTAPSYLTEDKMKEFNDFLAKNEESLKSSYVEMLSNYLVQMNGYFKQLLIHGEELISKEKQEEYIKRVDTIEEQSKNKIDSNLEDLIKNYFSLYNETNQVLLNTVNNNEEKRKLAQAVSTANDLLVKIDKSYVESDTGIDTQLLPIVELYKKALASEGNLQMATLIQLIDEEKRLIAKDKEHKAIEIATAKEKVFNLFDKINDQIVDKEFKKESGLVYARYKLEDGSSYYAIVPAGNKVLEEEKEFKTFSSFEMNRQKVEENLKLIINNIIIYYDLNEYTRYVEALYKGKMTPDIDQAIGQYKARLMTMENVLKSQLSFIDDIAPILNGKTSSKYPNIVYSDTLVKDFYPSELDNSLSQENIREQNKLMVKLADDTIPNDITSKEALIAIYGASIINKINNELATPSNDLTSELPVINNDKVEESNNSEQIVTNYQKISDYIKLRKNQLDDISKGNSNVSIEENHNSLYQSVNAIFDLNIAAAISDNQYSNGQGLYAISQYLKTGEANRFTSNMNARNLAISVSPNFYTSLLLENMIKSFAGSGKKASDDATYLDRMQQVLSFVKDELSKEHFSANEMKNSFLANDNLLDITIKNFDYDYLDPTSENSKLFDQAIEIGLNNNNSSAIRIKQAITDIKTLGKEKLVPTPLQNQNLVV